MRTAVIYHRILTHENVGTAVNYCVIFITLAPGVNIIKLITLVIKCHSMGMGSFKLFTALSNV